MTTEDDLAHWPRPTEGPRYNLFALTTPVIVAPLINPLPGALGFHKCHNCDEVMQWTSISGQSGKSYYERNSKPCCPYCGYKIIP